MNTLQQSNYWNLGLLMNYSDEEAFTISMRDFFVSEMNRVQAEIRELWGEYEECCNSRDREKQQKSQGIYKKIQMKDSRARRLFRKVRELDDFYKS